MTTPPTTTGRDRRLLLRRVRRHAAVSRRGLLGGAVALAGRHHDGRRGRRHRLAGPGGERLVRPRRAVAPRRRRRPLARRPARRTRSTTPPGRGSRSPRTGCRSSTDGFFGLHPAMADLLPLWPAGKVAAVHATGLPVANRSHFAAMEEMEDADPGSRERVGWLNRLVSGTPGIVAAARASAPAPAPSRPRWSARRPRCRPAASATSSCPAATSDGRRAAVAADHVEQREDDARPQHADHVRGHQRVRAGPGRGGQQATPTRAPAWRGALATAAQIIRGDVGVEVITVDQGDWDMHTDMGRRGRRLDGQQRQGPRPVDRGVLRRPRAPRRAR